MAAGTEGDSGRVCSEILEAYGCSVGSGVVCVGCGLIGIGEKKGSKKISKLLRANGDEVVGDGEELGRG